MLSSRVERYRGHSFLISAMQELKYTSDSDGNCAGIMQMGIQAFLVDELDVFNERIIRIHDIQEKIKSLKATKSGYALSQDPDYQQLILTLTQPDYLAFFDGIRLYQTPADYPHIFGDYISQYKPEAVSSAVISKKISTQGGLHQTNHYLSSYTKNDLMRFFTLIQESAGENKIAMSVSSNNHRTSICYDGRSKKWLLIDANQLPVHEVAYKDLSERIFSAHSLNRETFDTLPMSIRVYATGNDHVKIESCLDTLKNNSEFQSLQTITSEKALRTTKSRENLLHLAARYGHDESTNSMLNSIHLDANTTTASRHETPLYIAAYHGHLNVAASLLKKASTRIDLQNQSGYSPLYIAAKNGNKRMVALLLNYHANPYLSCNKYTNPVTIAAEKGHLHVLEIFSQHMVDLFKPDMTGKTALDYAKEKNHQPVIDYLQTKYKEMQKQKQVRRYSGDDTLRKHSLFTSSLVLEKKPGLEAPPAKRGKFSK